MNSNSVMLVAVAGGGLCCILLLVGAALVFFFTQMNKPSPTPAPPSPIEDTSEITTGTTTETTTSESTSGTTTGTTTGTATGTTTTGTTTTGSNTPPSNSGGGKKAVRVYENSDGTGKSYAYTVAGKYMEIGDGLNDAISRVDVPSGWSVRLYEHKNLGNKSKSILLTEGMYDLTFQAYGWEGGIAGTNRIPRCKPNKPNQRGVPSGCWNDIARSLKVCDKPDCPEDD